MNYGQTLPSLALVVVCFIGGALLRRFKKLPENAHLVLNNFIIYVSLPAMVIKSLRVIPMTTTYFGAALMPWLVFALSALFFLLLERLKIFARPTTLALIMTAGLANTSFVGFPMIEAFYGKQYIPVAVIIDQLGTFFVLVLVAIPLIDFLRIGEFDLRKAVKDLVLFPPFAALVLAFIFQKYRPIEPVYTVFERLGETLVPLAIFSVGLQWRANEIKTFAKELTFGLAFKLVVAPLCVLIIYSAVLYHPDLRKIVVLEAAMGPMITGGIIAMQKNINPPLVAAMLSVGIPLSLISALLVKLLFK